MDTNIQKKYYGFLLTIIDLSIFYISLILIVYLRFLNNFSHEILSLHIYSFTPIILLSVFMYFVNNLYEPNLNLKDFYFATLFGRIQIFILIFSFIYFYITPIGITPKTNLLLFWFLSSFLIFIVHSYINNKVILDKTNVLILEKTDFFKSIQEKINNDLNLNIKIIFFPDTADKEYFSEFLIQNNIKKIIFNEDFILEIKQYQKIPKYIKFQNFQDFFEDVYRKIPLEKIHYEKFVESINLNKNPLNLLLKRVFDVGLSLFLIILTLPFWPLIIVLILLSSPGPIFYLSHRLGKDNKEIMLYKFRTMQKNARTSGPAWTLPQDKRITKIGWFLRRFYIDEWPQFFNILKGDISFVGPRPEEHELSMTFKKEIPFYEIRSTALPGLTGWAQLNMPNTHTIIDAQEKLKFDLYYIKNYSFWLDLYIIIKTLKIPFV